MGTELFCGHFAERPLGLQSQRENRQHESLGSSFCRPEVRPSQSKGMRIGEFLTVRS